MFDMVQNAIAVVIRREKLVAMLIFFVLYILQEEKLHKVQLICLIPHFWYGKKDKAPI